MRNARLEQRVVLPVFQPVVFAQITIEAVVHTTSQNLQSFELAPGKTFEQTVNQDRRFKVLRGGVYHVFHQHGEFRHALGFTYAGLVFTTADHIVFPTTETVVANINHAAAFIGCIFFDDVGCFVRCRATQVIQNVRLGLLSGQQRVIRAQSLTHQIPRQVLSNHVLSSHQEAQLCADASVNVSHDFRVVRIKAFVVPVHCLRTNIIDTDFQIFCACFYGTLEFATCKQMLEQIHVRRSQHRPQLFVGFRFVREQGQIQRCVFHVQHSVAVFLQFQPDQFTAQTRRAGINAFDVVLKRKSRVHTSQTQNAFFQQQHTIAGVRIEAQFSNVVNQHYSSPSSSPRTVRTRTAELRRGAFSDSPRLRLTSLS
ncbi:hypothetical protein D3C80_865180 [compost metagenome]